MIIGIRITPLQLLVVFLMASVVAVLAWIFLLHLWAAPKGYAQLNNVTAAPLGEWTNPTGDCLKFTGPGVDPTVQFHVNGDGAGTFQAGQHGGLYFQVDSSGTHMWIYDGSTKETKVFQYSMTRTTLTVRQVDGQTLKPLPDTGACTLPTAPTKPRGVPRHA